MKLRLLKASCLPMVLFLFILTTTGCKKDKLEVNEVKEYREVGFVPTDPYFGGWTLTLKLVASPRLIQVAILDMAAPIRLMGPK